MATQLHDAESGEFDNPAVKALIEKLSQNEQLCTLIADDKDRLHLFEETENYIRDVVWGMLKRRPATVQHLNWLVNMVHDESVQSINLVTLNNDTALEQVLSSSSVSFCDGFGEPVNRVRFWQPDLFQDAERVRLVKLHGSIDWFFFRSDRNIGIPQNHDRWLTAPRPELLIGTFNKMLEYTRGIFADLHCYFHRCLRQTQFLVCCGYGFGDKGINTKLSEWINADPDRRLVVIHANSHNLFERSRGAIANHWTRLKKEKKLRLIEKWIEEISWDEVKQALLC